MISQFMAKKLKTARYKLLKDGSFFAEIPGLQGVWANTKNVEYCRNELQEVLEDWLLLKVQSRESIPGFQFKINRREYLRNA